MSKDFAGFKTLDEREKKQPPFCCLYAYTECLHLSAICTNTECLFNFILRKMEKIQQSLIFPFEKSLSELKGVKQSNLCNI